MQFAPRLNFGTVPRRVATRYQINSFFTLWKFHGPNTHEVYTLHKYKWTSYVLQTCRAILLHLEFKAVRRGAGKDEAKSLSTNRPTIGTGLSARGKRHAPKQKKNASGNCHASPVLYREYFPNMFSGKQKRIEQEESKIRTSSN